MKHRVPASMTYGRLVNTMLPYGEDEPIAPSPFQLCQAQDGDPALKLPGCVPGGDAMTYCAYWLSADVVLPKCPAALTASSPICWPVAWLGAATVLSYQTPASSAPAGVWMNGPFDGQVSVPFGTVSQYCVTGPVHCSPPVPRPLYISCNWGAPP